MSKIYTVITAYINQYMDHYSTDSMINKVLKTVYSTSLFIPYINHNLTISFTTLKE